MNKKLKYRIVTDNWAGYQAQCRLWWLPIWFTMSNSNLRTRTNTFKTVKEAKEFIGEKRQKAEFISKIVETDL